MLLCSLTKGITPKICRFCLVLRNSVLLDLLRVLDLWHHAWKELEPEVQIPRQGWEELESPEEIKSREVEPGSQSRVDCLVSELFLSSCFLDSVFVSLFRTAAETAISEVHKLFRTGGIPTSFTLLFWRWLAVSSVFTSRSARTRNLNQQYKFSAGKGLRITLQLSEAELKAWSEHIEYWDAFVPPNHMQINKIPFAYRGILHPGTFYPWNKAEGKFHPRNIQLGELYGSVPPVEPFIRDSTTFHPARFNSRGTFHPFNRGAFHVGTFHQARFHQGNIPPETLHLILFFYRGRAFHGGIFNLGTLCPGNVPQGKISLWTLNVFHRGTFHARTFHRGTTAPGNIPTWNIQPGTQKAGRHSTRNTPPFCPRNIPSWNIQLGEKTSGEHAIRNTPPFSHGNIPYSPQQNKTKTPPTTKTTTNKQLCISNLY